MDISLLNSYNKASQDYALKKDKLESKKTDKAKNSFKKLLDNSMPSVVSLEVDIDTKEITELMDTLFSNGEMLVRDPSLSNLKLYRDSISVFFKYVVKKGLNFENFEGRMNPKTFERKGYSIITVIDSKIDGLAKSILGDQKKQLDLLSAVEEINGLIVDIIS